MSQPSAEPGVGLPVWALAAAGVVAGGLGHALYRAARDQARGNPTFRAVEFDLDTMEPTERVEYYGGKNIKDAVKHVLYTKRLSSGTARVGPSGRTVVSQGMGYSVAPCVKCPPLPIPRRDIDAERLPAAWR